MPVVLDANLFVAAVGDDPRGPAVTALLQHWTRVGEDLHAPALFPYEVANAMTRLIVAGAFPRDRMGDAWQTVATAPITYHPLEIEGDRLVNIALRLRRSSAYYAAYIALAEQLGAELWTLDGPLARNATGLGYPVHLVQ